MMIKDKKYFYNVRAIPDDNSVFWQRDRGRYLSRYNFVGGFAEGKRVLDIACGAGYGSNLLAEKGSLKVVGADVAEDAVEFANEKYKTSVTEFIVMSATDMSAIPDGSIDIVCSMGTIEHVDDVGKFISEVKRVLAPDGRWFVSTLNKLKKKSEELIDHHFQEYTPAEFTGILDKEFGDVELYGHRLNKTGATKAEENRRFRWVPLWIKLVIDKLSLGKKIRSHVKKSDKPLEINDYQWIKHDINETCNEVIAICTKPLLNKQN